MKLHLFGLCKFEVKHKSMKLASCTCMRVSSPPPSTTGIPVNFGPAPGIPVNFGPASGIPFNFGLESRILIDRKSLRKIILCFFVSYNFPRRPFTRTYFSASSGCGRCIDFICKIHVWLTICLLIT